jgi:hypothetical protein
MIDALDMTWNIRPLTTEQSGGWYSFGSYLHTFHKNFAGYLIKINR